MKLFEEYNPFFKFLLIRISRVKYYDFEITEYGFINDVKDAKEFEKIIKNMDNVYDIHKYITPEVLKQCSKIKPLFT